MSGTVVFATVPRRPSGGYLFVELNWIDLRRRTWVTGDRNTSTRWPFLSCPPPFLRWNEETAPTLHKFFILFFLFGASRTSPVVSLVVLVSRKKGRTTDTRPAAFFYTCDGTYIGTTGPSQTKKQAEESLWKTWSSWEEEGTTDGAADQTFHVPLPADENASATS